jgi:hypothetical protein
MRIAERLDDIVRLYGAGLSIPTIAKVMGVSDGGLYKALTQAGIHRPGTKKQRLKKQLSQDQFLRACYAILHETRTLERCPGCLRKRTLFFQDLGPLGWIAMCDPQDCGFVWYRRNGPPEFVGGPKKRPVLGRCRL